MFETVLTGLSYNSSYEKKLSYLLSFEIIIDNSWVVESVVHCVVCQILKVEAVPFIC